MQKALFWCCLLAPKIILAQFTTLHLDYIQAWKKFYPSIAVELGMHDAVYDYEDRSSDAIRDWIDFNKDYVKFTVPESDIISAQINSRLVRIQIDKEIDKWENDQPHHHHLSEYTKLIDGAVHGLDEMDFLTQTERTHLIFERLKSAKKLCAAGQQNLIRADKQEAKLGISLLVKTANYIQDSIRAIFRSDIDQRTFTNASEDAVIAIGEFVNFIETNIQPKAKVENSILGADNYARKWAHYSDSDLSPDSLAEMARNEITLVKEKMLEVAKRYWYTKKQEPSPLTGDEKILQKALADMESDVTSNAIEYTAFWHSLADSLVAFLKEKQIATVPDHPTLSIRSAPERAGPAARIGWVSSAPPFAPNPWTTLYLPSIPDTLPENEQIAFWSSFNKPFNRMIAIHELFPGHYMQIKVSRETPHSVRLLFPYGPYFEGWATFCEEIVLAAGWDADKPLSMLAHLRKRLENANRAYTSVMVHCHGWDQDKVLQFSTEVALLAPQFAKSLWGRIMRGPMQMTSYFYGSKLFRDLYQETKGLKDKEFVLKDFMDTVMRTGPIPIKMFTKLF